MILMSFDRSINTAKDILQYDRQEATASIRVSMIPYCLTVECSDGLSTMQAYRENINHNTLNS